MPVEIARQHRLRVAQQADARALAALLPNLGYAVTPDQVAARLQHLLASPDYGVLLAEWDGQVVGLCLLSSVKHLASEGYVEVLELVAAGCTTAEAAQLLGVAASTVETQVEAAMRKLGVRSRFQAAAMVGGLR